MYGAGLIAIVWLHQRADAVSPSPPPRRALAQADDLWDFGTVRHVQARPDGPATIRRRQQQLQQQYQQYQQYQHPPPQQHSRAPPQAPHSRAPAPAEVVRSHDFADTVRGSAPPSSAHSVYDEYSSAASSSSAGTSAGAGTPRANADADARARTALDRERQRLERLRLAEEERERERDREEELVRAQQQQQQYDQGPDVEEEGGEILDTVVLPVLDSVRRCLFPFFLTFFLTQPETDVVARDGEQIHDRITNPAARESILRFRAALQQVEREVPGLINVFVSEVVDSVEVSLARSRSLRPRVQDVDEADASSAPLSARSLSQRASEVVSCYHCRCAQLPAPVSTGNCARAALDSHSPSRPTNRALPVRLFSRSLLPFTMAAWPLCYPRAALHSVDTLPLRTERAVLYFVARRLDRPACACERSARGVLPSASAVRTSDGCGHGDCC